MNNTQIKPIVDILQRIELKLDSEFHSKYFGINKVAEITSLSPSTIRRAVESSELKCVRRKGKLIFKDSEVYQWIEKKESK
jgi:predicted DNA-binding transcriptional regulator AlpA